MNESQTDKVNLLALNDIFLHTNRALIGHILVVAFMTLILDDFLSFTIILLWFSMQVLNFYIRSLIVQKYLKIRDTIESYADAKPWLRYYSISVFISGVLWGLSVISLGEIPREYHYLMAVVIIGVAFAAVTTLGLLQEVFMLFTVPMLSMLFFSFLKFDDNINYLSFSLIVLAYLYAHNAATQIADNFKITKLEQAKTAAIQKELIEQKNMYNHQAHHDFLTGLPNRILFNDRLEQALKSAKRNNTKVALLFLDLDRFKDINDTLGHKIGDEILVSIANRLKYVVREEDTISRLGGDEFTIVIQDLKEIQDVSLLAQKIIDALQQAIILEEHALSITTSIGISIFPEDTQDMQSLIRFSDMAMYKAKEFGRNNYKFYASKES